MKVHMTFLFIVLSCASNSLFAQECTSDELCDGRRNDSITNRQTGKTDVFCSGIVFGNPPSYCPAFELIGYTWWPQDCANMATNKGYVRYQTQAASCSLPGGKGTAPCSACYARKSAVSQTQSDSGNNGQTMPVIVIPPNHGPGIIGKEHYLRKDLKGTTAASIGGLLYEWAVVEAVDGRLVKDPETGVKYIKVKVVSTPDSGLSKLSATDIAKPGDVGWVFALYAGYINN